MGVEWRNDAADVGAIRYVATDVLSSPRFCRAGCYDGAKTGHVDCSDDKAIKDKDTRSSKKNPKETNPNNSRFKDVYRDISSLSVFFIALCMRTC